MQNIHGRDVKALELRAPGVSAHDADEILRLLEAGKVFAAFTYEDRMQIHHRLLQFDSLIPSLHTFFRNLTFWEACVESMKHLTILSRRDTIFSAFERQFTGVNQQDGQVVVQVDESNLATTRGSLDDQIEFGYRQILLFVMRHFMDIPYESINHDITVRPRVKANQAVLRRFAKLATRLGFESSKIHALLMSMWNVLRQN
jgi:hypothetical protein